MLWNCKAAPLVHLMNTHFCIIKYNFLRMILSTQSYIPFIVYSDLEWHSDLQLYFYSNDSIPLLIFVFETTTFWEWFYLIHTISHLLCMATWNFIQISNPKYLDPNDTYVYVKKLINSNLMFLKLHFVFKYNQLG